MTAHHTPGPWIAVHSDVLQRSEGIVIETPNGYEVRPLGPQALGDEFHDLALIENAPQLLSCLQELVDIIKGHLEDGDKLDSFTLQPAIQAIANATCPINPQLNNMVYQEHFVNLERDDHESYDWP